jgi:enamine deaminase RidA (YjgF/YER057c/UK114 family)
MRAVERRAINPWAWSVRRGFNQAELVSSPTRWLVCSGQTSIDGDGQVQHADDIAGQVGAAYDNLETVLRDAGMTLDDVVRITCYTTDVDGLIRSGAMMRGGHKAFTLIGVARLAYPDLMVELEAIAAA